MQQCSQWRVLYFIEFIDRATLPAAPGAALRPRHHSPEEQAALLAEVQALGRGLCRGKLHLVRDSDRYVLGFDGGMRQQAP